MTGATPQGRGDTTQPMASPPWLAEPAAGAGPAAPTAGPGAPTAGPIGRPDRGPYADADTVDELDAVVAGPDVGQDHPAVAGPGQDPPSAGPGAPLARGAGADWPDAARPPVSGGPLLAWLWGEQGQAGEYLLAGHPVTVGRDPGSDVVLADATVSSEHARIEYREGQWWLLLADSAGPTWVNGQPAEPGQRLPVTDGDRLRFGFHTQFRLLVPSAR